MGFMLARLQAKYGQVPRLNEVMPHVVAGMESQGWKLLGAYGTTIGRFHEVWDLWEIPGGAGEISRALQALRSDPEFVKWAAMLPDIVESEETRYMEKLPYSP